MAMDEIKFTPVKLGHIVFKPNSFVDKELSPMIFLHGVIESKESWNDIPQKVADGSNRMVYALDSRNHGDSEWNDENCLDSQAVDVVNFMDIINAPKAILVGHSMGGFCASRIALLWPERVEAVFIVDVTIRRVSMEVMRFSSKYMHLCQEGVRNIPKDLKSSEHTKFVVDYAYKKLFSGANMDLTEKENLYKCPCTLKKLPNGGFDVKHNVEVLQETFQDNVKFMPNPEGEYDGPSFFLYGSLSFTNVHKDKDLIKKHFPNVKFIEFVDGRHHLHLQFPEKFINTILKCIQIEIHK